jgi:Rv0078B-related antitoxin
LSRTNYFSHAFKLATHGLRLLRDTQITLTSDTSEKAQGIYFQRLNEMTPSERLSLGVALWEAGYALQRAAVCRKNPNADEAEITFQIAVTRFGLELAQKVYRKK